MIGREDVEQWPSVDTIRGPVAGPDAQGLTSLGVVMLVNRQGRNPFTVGREEGHVALPRPSGLGPPGTRDQARGVTTRGYLVDGHGKSQSAIGQVEPVHHLVVVVTRGWVVIPREGRGIGPLEV